MRGPDSMKYMHMIHCVCLNRAQQWLLLCAANFMAHCDTCMAEWHQQSHKTIHVHRFDKHVDFNKLSFWPGTVTELQNFLILNNTGLIVAVGKLAYSCQKGRLLRFFFNRDGWRHQNGWIFGTFPKGGGFRSASFKVCLVLIFLNTIVEKTYPEPWNDPFVSFSCSKSPV